MVICWYLPKAVSRTETSFKLCGFIQRQIIPHGVLSTTSTWSTFPNRSNNKSSFISSRSISNPLLYPLTSLLINVLPEAVWNVKLWWSRPSSEIWFWGCPNICALWHRSRRRERSWDALKVVEGRVNLCSPGTGRETVHYPKEISSSGKPVLTKYLQYDCMIGDLFTGFTASAFVFVSRWLAQVHTIADRQSQQFWYLGN